MEHKHLIKNKTGSIFQLIIGFKANANLKITNGVIFEKVGSHRVNVAMKHGIDYDRNNPLQQRILPLTPTHLSNPISSLKFIGKSKLEGAGFASTTFQAFELIVVLALIADFQLVVEYYLIKYSEEAIINNQKSQFIVAFIYSKISLHFCKDCRIFCEGVKETIIDAIHR